MKRDSVISNDSIIIAADAREFMLQNSIIKGKDQEIQDLNKALQKANRRKTFLKIGWISSAVLLGTLLLLRTF
jgi:hypothetical protein